MKIRNKLNPSNPCFSFEFFPPKTEAGVQSLWQTLDELKILEPGFVSVTYGAGGSTKERSIDLVCQMRQRTRIEIVAHLTCVGHTRDEVSTLLDQFEDAGIENLLALRGDAPHAGTGFPVTTDGFRYASDLVDFVRSKKHSFYVGAACYPEGHIETLSKEDDLRNLKKKVDAGVDFLITQLFFDNAFYFDFVERARRNGINIPIVPGIMPITNYEQLQRFVRMCGATIPMRLALALEKVKDDPQALIQLGIAHATVQCMELLQRGVPGIHFYTLNKSPATRMIVSALKGRA